MSRACVLLILSKQISPMDLYPHFYACVHSQYPQLSCCNDGDLLPPFNGTYIRIMD